MHDAPLYLIIFFKTFSFALAFFPLICLLNTCLLGLLLVKAYREGRKFHRGNLKTYKLKRRQK